MGSLKAASEPIEDLCKGIFSQFGHTYPLVINKHYFHGGEMD